MLHNDHLLHRWYARTFVQVISVDNCFRLERIIFSGSIEPSWHFAKFDFRRILIAGGKWKMENRFSVFGTGCTSLWEGFSGKWKIFFPFSLFLHRSSRKQGHVFRNRRCTKGKKENRITSTSQHGDHHLRDHCDQKWLYESSPPCTYFLFMSCATLFSYKVSSNSLMWSSCGLKQVKIRMLSPSHPCRLRISMLWAPTGVEKTLL